MFTVYRYRPVDESEWDHFVTRSNNGTIFHQRKFLSYHRERIFKDCSLMFVEKTTLCAVFTGAIINNCLYYNIIYPT